MRGRQYFSRLGISSCNQLAVESNTIGSEASKGATHTDEAKKSDRQRAAETQLSDSLGSTLMGRYARPRAHESRYMYTLPSEAAEVEIRTRSRLAHAATARVPILQHSLSNTN